MRPAPASSFAFFAAVAARLAARDARARRRAARPRVVAVLREAESWENEGGGPAERRVEARWRY